MKALTPEEAKAKAAGRIGGVRNNPFTGLLPVLRKEAIHIRRDPMALFFTILIPTMQLFMIGFAINTNVRDIPTVVYDAARTQESRRLLDRYLRAIDHPLVNVITHPANRTPGGHPGYDLDFDRLFEAAARSGTAVEIDGSPNHLDLDGALARRATASGAMLTIDSDAHRHDALGRQLQFGVGTARRGWVQPEQVLNTRGAVAIRAFVAAKRPAGGPRP